MGSSQFALKDPRTIARDIPGIFDAIFPQLTAGTVAYFNREIKGCGGAEAVPECLVEASGMKHAMLFEIAGARAEQLLNSQEEADWAECVRIATEKQRRHFDATVPSSISDTDLAVAEHVGRNLVSMLGELQTTMPGEKLKISPRIPGYQWVMSGRGDFALGEQTLIEVKCTSKKFGSPDYRQISMYWLLSYASSLERDASEWTIGFLLNPRLNYVLEISFDQLIDVTAGGKSKVEVLELFASTVGDYALKALPEFRL